MYIERLLYGMMCLQLSFSKKPLQSVTNRIADKKNQFLKEYSFGALIVSFFLTYSTKSFETLIQKLASNSKALNFVLNYILFILIFKLVMDEITKSIVPVIFRLHIYSTSLLLKMGSSILYTYFFTLSLIWWLSVAFFYTLVYK